MIAPAHQGKGFATEAVEACIEELFRMGFAHIRAGFFEGNVASCRVMEKCGMRKEGELRQRLYNKGKFVDVALYAILRSDPRRTV